MRKAIFISCCALVVSLLILTDLSILEDFSIVLFIYFFLDFLEILGKRIAILELINIIASFTCLIMPVIFYHEYTRDNYLARVWVKYMPVDSESYFSFMVPAVIALAIGLRMPLGKLRINKDPRTYMTNMGKSLQNKSSIGFTLIGIGFASGLLTFLPIASLREFFNLMAHLTFVGVFYVLYSPNKQKKVVVFFVLSLMIAQTIAEAMFGEVIFILACALPLVLLGTNISFVKKTGIALAGIFLIVVLQSIKVDYRKRLSLAGGESDPLYYGQLVTDKITDPTTMISEDQLFKTSVRMNQGWLVGTTMKMVPSKFDFAYGETIATSVAAAIVPRFLWPDKPEAGGKANLKRFWGYNIGGL